MYMTLYIMSHFMMRMLETFIVHVHLIFNFLIPLSPTEPLPSSIDSWARGIVQQQSTSQLQSKIDSAQPVHILPFMIDTTETAQSEQQGEEGTDSHQENQRRKSLLSETTTSSIGKWSRYSVKENLGTLRVQ